MTFPRSHSRRGQTQSWNPDSFNHNTCKDATLVSPISVYPFHLQLGSQDTFPRQLRPTSIHSRVLITVSFQDEEPSRTQLAPGALRILPPGRGKCLVLSKDENFGVPQLKPQTSVLGWVSGHIGLSGTGNGPMCLLSEALGCRPASFSQVFPLVPSLHPLAPVPVCEAAVGKDPRTRSQKRKLRPGGDARERGLMSSPCWLLSSAEPEPPVPHAEPERACLRAQCRLKDSQARSSERGRDFRAASLKSRSRVGTRTQVSYLL